MKLGILGGTFDPVHSAHVGMAEQARDALALDEVLFVPAGTPATHRGERITPAEHRLAMLRLALEGRAKLNISDLEMDRPGTSYTVDTLAELRRRYGTGAELYFIMGADSLLLFGQWRKPDRILELCRLAVVPRPGYGKPGKQEMEGIMTGLAERVEMLQNEVGDISASEVREMARRGEPLGHLVPAPVAEYITAHQVYRGGIV